jgi:toxin YoeB
LPEWQKVKLQQLLQDVIAINPYSDKALKGDLKGFYSYRLNRLNRKDRVVYEIYEQDTLVLIARARTHYGE